MENYVEETKKTWVAPELKKIDVEEVTADDGGPNADGGINS